MVLDSSMATLTKNTGTHKMSTRNIKNSLTPRSTMEKNSHTNTEEIPSSKIDEIVESTTDSEQAFFDINALMEDSAVDTPNDRKTTNSENITAKASTIKSKAKTGKYLTLEDKQILTDEQGQTSTVSNLHNTMEIEQKHTIHCPFPNHEDSKPSAFVEKKDSGDLFFFCSSCQGKAWYPSKKEKSNVVQLPFTGNPPLELYDENGKHKSVSTILIELGSHFDLFHDTFKEAYASIDIDGVKHVVPVNSSNFEERLAHTYFIIKGKAANAASIKDAKATLSSIAKYNGRETDVNIRVVKRDDAVYIDTCCSNRSIIKLDANGYDLLLDSDEMFEQKSGMIETAAIAPHGKGDISLLRKYANVSDDDFALLRGWLFCVAAGAKPYPILVLQGEQGTGKSTMSRVLRALTDPSSAPVRNPPSNETDLVVSAINNFLLAFDNIDGLKPEMANGFCRLSTGTAFGVRKLFTNGEEFLAELQRPVIINGISGIATRPDFAERAIIIELLLIDPSQRKTEKEYWAEFELDKSIIYTGILDGIVSGLKHQNDVEIAEKPRMADLAEWVTGCERELGMEGNFLKAYMANQATSKQDGIEASPIGAAIMTLMADRASYSGTPTELLKKLEEVSGSSLSASREWSATTKQLHGSIKRLMPSFRSIGIEITQKKSGSRKYVIENTQFNGESADSTDSSEVNNLPVWLKK